METLVILDYNTGGVHLFYVSPGTEVDEEFIVNLGFNLDECYWMMGENTCITLHKDILK